MSVVEVPVAPAGDDLVPVLVWVPARRAPRIQAQIHLLLAADERPRDPDGPYQPPHTNTFGPTNAWDLPEWEAPDDAPAADWLARSLGSTQFRLLAQLVAAGPAGIWTGELRRGAGYDPATSMSGVFKAIGGRFRSVGRKPAWRGGEKDSQKGQRLQVPDGPARDLLRAALRAANPSVAEECGL